MCGSMGVISLTPHLDGRCVGVNMVCMCHIRLLFCLVKQLNDVTREARNDIACVEVICSFVVPSGSVSVNILMYC
jgi:hypothetical protein